MKRNFLIVLMMLNAAVLMAQHPFQNESHLDSTFDAFYSKLNQVITYQDTVELMSLFDDQIDNGMMDYYVKEELFPYHEQLWKSLNMS